LRSPCSLAVRIRAITPGRRTRTRLSSSARSRSAPSAVSAATLGSGASAGETAWLVGVAASAGDPQLPSCRSGRSRRRRSTPGLGWLAARPFGVAVGELDHARRWRGGLCRLRQQRTGQAGRLARSVDPPEVGEREDHVAVRKACPLGRRHAVGKGLLQGILVLLGRIRRRPPDPEAVEAAEVISQRPPAWPPVAELRPGHRRQPPADRGVRAADVQNRLRRQPEGREAGGQRLRARPGAIAAKRLDPLEPLADPGQLDRGAWQRAGSSMAKTPGPGADTGRPIAPGRRPGGRPSATAEVRGGTWDRAHGSDGTRAAHAVSCPPPCA
jgi:hypothetical protein